MINPNKAPLNPQPLVERIARQEALMESVQDTTRRIETKVDRLIDQDN